MQAKRWFFKYLKNISQYERKMQTWEMKLYRVVSCENEEFVCETWHMKSLAVINCISLSSFCSKSNLVHSTPYNLNALFLL